MASKGYTFNITGKQPISSRSLVVGYTSAFIYTTVYLWFNNAGGSPTGTGKVRIYYI